MTEPAPFPSFRARRLRRHGVLRDAVADVSLHPSDLIHPLFVGDMDAPQPVASMPGVSQLPVDEAVRTIRELSARGLTQFILFGVTPTQHKDPAGSYAQAADAPVNRTLMAVREAGLDVVMYADLCFCEYTDHGHCGVLAKPGDSSPRALPVTVDNDVTLNMLGCTAVAQANAGADVVAPSGMIDGQVRTIRAALDDAGHNDTAILSYSIKYASHFYGPFRDAGEGGVSPDTGGDRRTHQMDYRRSREWRTELAQDVAEGADMVMVKPAGAYLDIIRGVREHCDLPVAAYHVSGEYAMLHAAAERGWLDLPSAALETTYSIRRAGADLVITYFAPKLLDWMG